MLAGADLLAGAVGLRVGARTSAEGGATDAAEPFSVEVIPESLRLELVGAPVIEEEIYSVCPSIALTWVPKPIRRRVLLPSGPRVNEVFLNPISKALGVICLRASGVVRAGLEAPVGDKIKCSL